MRSHRVGASLRVYERFDGFASVQLRSFVVGASLHRLCVTAIAHPCATRKKRVLPPAIGTKAISRSS